MADLAVIKYREVAAARSTRPRSVLRVGEVEVPFAFAHGRALDGLAVLVNRGEQLLLKTVLPARVRRENPFDFLVTADLHHTLMACGDDDGIVARIVGNGVDVRPVAARTHTRDIAEVGVTEGGFGFIGNLLARGRDVHIHADGTEVEVLDEVVTGVVEDLI